MRLQLLQNWLRVSLCLVTPSLSTSLQLTRYLLSFSHPYSIIIFMIPKQPPSPSPSSPQQHNLIYRLLPQARPLHPHKPTPVAPLSLFTFVTEGPEIGCYDSQPTVQIQSVEQGRNVVVHELGSKLCSVFKEEHRVYQSYEGLQLGEDNLTFATVAVDYATLTKLKPHANPPVPPDRLSFESRFQGGNLALAAYSPFRPRTYNLAIQRDTNSKATCQWYYFSVTNGDNLGVYTFCLVNMVKNYSAYEYGMRPCVWSEGLGWHRGGFDIGYRRNTVPYRGQRHYYTLEFRYEFMGRNQRVWFAYGYPYTYARMQACLGAMEGGLARVKVLAKTPCGNNVNMVSITAGNQNIGQKQQQTITKAGNKKDLIMITARVHPGQTNSSFICQGLLQFLLSDSPQAIRLRQHYIIKIVPFLNPDGVIHGNYRTSIVGHDLNRKYKRPDKQLHPEIYTVKKYLADTNYNKVLFIDLHGHSKKKSAFMYGCLNKQQPYMVKQFPYLLSKNSSNFCYYNCNFSTPASREGTSRICVWKQFSIDYSYTMEVSFCGAAGRREQFRVRDYVQMGRQLGRGIGMYFGGRRGKMEQGVKGEQGVIWGQEEQGGQGELEPVGAILRELYAREELLEVGLDDSEGSESGEEESPDRTVDQRQKQNPIESSKQLKGILSKYMQQTKIKWARKEQNLKTFLHKRSQQKMAALDNCSFIPHSNMSSTLRNRRQVQPSRLMLQKIDLSEQVGRTSLNFGLSTEKSRIKLSSRELKGFIVKQHTRFRSHSGHSKAEYRPYSLTKGQLAAKRVRDEFSLMLPNLAKEEEIKYKKMRKNQSQFQYDLNATGQQSGKGRTGQRYSSKQLSTAQKIFQNSHKNIQENLRYFTRNLH